MKPDSPALEDELSGDQLPLRPFGHHLALSIYWLSNTTMWGALLHLALQSRLSDWFEQDRVGYYIGLLGFAGGIVATVTQIVAGAFSDRSLSPWGRRRPYIVAGTSLSIAALMLLGAAKSYWPFAGALILVQLFTNAALAPFTALLPDTVNPAEHGKSAAFMGPARLFGDIGGLLLAGLLLNADATVSADKGLLLPFHEHRMVLLCTALGGLFFLGMVYTCLAIKERPLRSRPEATVWETARGSFKMDIKGNPDFFWLSLSRAVTNLGFYMFLAVSLFYVKYSLGHPDPKVGNPDSEHTTMLIMLPAIVVAGLSSAPSGIISDRVGRRPLIFFAQYAMAVGALAFVFAPTLRWAVLAGIPAGIAYGVFTSVEWALACNLLPAGESARYLGIWNASAALPQILSMPLAGLLGSAISAHRPGLGWRVDFAVAAVCCLAGAYFLRYVRERFPAKTGGPPVASQ